MATDILAVNSTTSVINLSDTKASYDNDAGQGANAALVFTAVQPGVRGNEVKVVMRNIGDDEAHDLSVEVYEVEPYQWVDITLETDEANEIQTTADEVKALLAADLAASQLVTAADKAGNDGSGVVSAMGVQALTGGAKDDILPQECREMDAVSDADLAALVAAGACVVKQSLGTYSGRREIARALKYYRQTAPRL